VPTRRTVGQTVLDHEPYRQINDAVGVLTAGWRPIRQVSREVLLTLRTWLTDKTQTLYVSSRFLVRKNQTSLATFFILFL
jgi:hypothetical protein